MVSINQEVQEAICPYEEIYIPLWYLLILGDRQYCGTRSNIYIPLWYLLINPDVTVTDAAATFTFHYGIY